MKYHIESSNDYQLLAQLNRSVQELHVQLFPEDFKPYEFVGVESAFKKMLVDSSVFAFVAKDGDNPIGYLLCMIQTREESAFQYEKTTLLIDQIAVDPAHRGAGVAKKLIEEVIVLAKEKDIAEIQVEYWEGNKVAGHFFAKQGFRNSSHKMIKQQK